MKFGGKKQTVIFLSPQEKEGHSTALKLKRLYLHYLSAAGNQEATQLHILCLVRVDWITDVCDQSLTTFEKVKWRSLVVIGICHLIFQSDLWNDELAAKFVLYAITQ